MDKGSFVSIDLTKTESKDQIYVQKDTVGNSNQNNWCTYFRNGMFRAIRSVGKIPTDLMDAWRNSTTPQKVMHTVIAVYCTAATVYIIYLESQTGQTSIHDLHEIKKVSSLLNQPSLEESSENYGHALNSAFKKCEKEFEESGAEETSLSGVISMQICYPLINRVCEASEDILQIISKLKKIPKALRKNLQLNDINRVNNHLKYIQNKFFCKDKGILLSH